MTTRQNQLNLFPLALLLLSGASRAADATSPGVEFNAYGTLSAVRSSDERADFVTSLTQAEGAGFSDEVAFGVDSRLGLQLTATFSPKLSAVVQVVSEQQYDNSFTPVVEWANVKYDVTPDFSVRAGRIVLPTFMTSDYRKVGYANHWVRPPVEVYYLLPVTNNDGVDASYRLRFGRFTNTLLGYAGNKDAELPAGSVEGRGSRGLFNTLEFGAAQFRLGYSRSHLTSDSINSFFGLFRQFGAQGNAIADRYDLDDTRIETMVLGGRYEPGNWFTMAEWVRSSSDSFIGTNRAWYISGGYRHSSLTPYVTYARKKRLGNSMRERGLDLTGLPPALQGFATGINAGLGGMLRPSDSATLTLGTRWDFAANFSATLQLDHVRAADNSYGISANAQPGLMLGRSFNVVTAAISFVY
jgi:hypothetical protein